MMNNTSYVIMSRQAGLSKELTSVANNIANADTTGFRREGVLFSEYVKSLGSSERSLSQTRVGGHFYDRSGGAMTKTGGAFDVAIDGEGFFAVETPRGERLTRAGSFMLNSEGQLTTPEGYSVLGEGGSPITIPPGAGEITIAADGAIAGGSVPLGRLTLVTAPETALQREGGSLFKANEPTQAAERAQLRQGFVEGSNVNSVVELSRLIEVQRAYELGQQLLQQEHDRIKKTVEAMGPR
jgi:flagellar basal-body rod protein FlgF